MTGSNVPGMFVKVEEQVIFKCLANYKKNTAIVVPDLCSVCARAIIGMQMMFVDIGSTF
jgi:hypothetical protein